VTSPAQPAERVAPPSPLTRVAAATAQILQLRHQREVAICQAIENGATWAALAAALGISAQAAHKHYRWLRYSPTTGETWYAPPLPTRPNRPASAPPPTR
jgi:hypothetical protein